MNEKVEEKQLTKLADESQNLYRAAPIGLCHFDTDLRYVQINEWLADINGVPIEAHLGKTIGEVVKGVADNVVPQLRHVLEMGEPIIGGEVEAETKAHPGEVRNFQHNYYPVKSEDGMVVGVSCAVMDITDRKQAEEKIRHLAYHDELTGLATLRLCKDRLSGDIALARRNKSGTALLFLDLDGFKGVNDSLGHKAGDQVLIEVGERLTQSVRETDTIARVGGDEFIIIFTQVKKKEFIIMMVENIIKTLNQPIMINGQNVNIGTSIGIALYPDHGEIPDELIKQADEAMYVVKHKGKNNYAIA